MYMMAYQIAGIKISNESFTKSEFDIIKKANPNINLDDAILIFEKAKKGVSLEKFATTKQRTAESYRRVFRKYFD
jgi:hypothetical protein